MRKQLPVIHFLLFATVVGLILLAVNSTSAETSEQQITAQIIAREKASIAAWQKKDKAFYTDFLTDDATFFSSESPYLETDPKQNFLPKFDQYAEMFKINDFQMHNPRVQVYGDTAILTYNSTVSVSFSGQPLNYTAKVTSVYVKQGNTWRVVHAHETVNPAAK
ncbi:MAG TPA: nuclear transport factor 2 family protein [Pyrinomonadaceae bacterium]